MMITLSDRVRQICKAEKISEKELQVILKLTAPHYQEGVTRRYHEWLFDIRDGVCHNMRLASKLVVGDPRNSEGFMEEEHLDCDGQGCVACGWIGVVKRYI